MSVNAICKEIEAISNEVEALIAAENEETCSRLLQKRQRLLEQLAEQVSNNEMPKTSYYEFLSAIQNRDAAAMELIAEQKGKIISAGAQQKKKTAAVNLYQKYSE